jgi:hypothetical protein
VAYLLEARTVELEKHPLLGTALKQHLSLGNGFLMNSYTQPLLRNAIINRQVPMQTIGVQQWKNCSGRCFLRGPCKGVK